MRNRLSKLIALTLIIEISSSWKLWIPIDRDFPIVSAFSTLDFNLGSLGDGLEMVWEENV